MHVLTIIGSPRKHSTSTKIAEHFCKLAEEGGHTVTSHILNKMDYRGCQGCETCHTKLEKCVLRDDLTPVFEQMHEADVVVFTSPIYFGDLSSQARGFFDRTYSLVSPDFMTNPDPGRLPKGKKALFAISQGADETTHSDIPQRYEKFLKMAGFEDVRFIRDCSRLDPNHSSPAQTSLDIATQTVADFLT